MADILIVDDEADIRAIVGDILRDEGHCTREAKDADGALGEVNTSPPSLIILDIWLQGSRMDGIEILKSVKRDNPDLPVVIISGHGNVELAVAAIKQGAYDFIEKPFNTDQLIVVVQRALEASRLRRENANLRAREISEARLVGESAAATQLRSKIERVARTGSRVLLQGPAGSGKEVAARAIHAKSDRADGPFVVVNAASIEPQHMEATLFGLAHPDGRIEPGVFERAHGGTLFVDEVADMQMGTQSKILRVLTEQSFTRPGGGDIVRVNARLVSATARDLGRLVEQGEFRRDLFHRLAVVPIDVPGLSARCDDIPLLVDHFIRKLSKSEGLARKRMTPEAIAALQTMDWPGNVRQLRNLVERLLIMGGEAEEICLADLPEMDAAAGGGAAGGVSIAIAALPLREARELFEREYLVAQINRFGGNISRTAQFVGMERSALHRKLKSLGVSTAARDGSRVARVDQDEGAD